jgi:hypothetical protein
MFRNTLHLLGLFTTLLACAAPGGGRPEPAPHPYVGMWVTADRRIRQELLANGRYEEERDGRKRAYTGRYTCSMPPPSPPRAAPATDTPQADESRVRDGRRHLFGQHGPGAGGHRIVGNDRQTSSP